MGGTKSKRIEISPISKQDIANVQAFLEKGFGRGAGVRWRDKHLEQPLSLPVDAPVGVLARRDNQSVGHFGAVFWHLSTPGKTVLASCPGDLLISPEIQSTPLAGRIYTLMWNRLFKQIQGKGASICIGFGNKRSMRLHVRFAGGYIQKMRRVLTWRYLPGIPIALQRIFWPVWWQLCSGGYQDLSVETKPPDKEALGNLWASCYLRQKHNLYTRKAEDILYRYGHCSYHVWGVWSPRKLLGYVVWDQHDRVIVIKDILTVSSLLTRPVLIAVLKKIMAGEEKSGHNFLKIRLLGDPSIGSLFMLGFRMAGEPILWAIRSCAMQEEKFAEFMRTGNWYFTMGDVDQW